jgi:RNA polymerase sigma-70 factor (ECF subfamily)
VRDLDFEILSGLRNGDKKSFNLLFESYYENLCHYTASILHDHDSAEDIVQDLFADIWIQRNRLNIETSLSSYLYRSVYHATLDYLKHLKVRDRFESVLSLQPPISYDDSMVISEMAKQIENSINQLPEQCRLIFKLSRVENLKYREIAEKLEISENTVDTQIRRALNRLKEDLKDYLVIILFLFHIFF